MISECSGGHMDEISELDVVELLVAS